MIRLEKSETSQKIIRQDDIAELATSTWDLAREAIQAGSIGKALEFIEYGCAETRTMHDTMISVIDYALTRLASFNEEEIEGFLRQRYSPMMGDWLSNAPGVEENLYRCAEYQRSHFGDFTIQDEPDRYVIRCDPCGSGGRLRRTRSVQTTKKAYAWSWGKEDIPYYCIHCCLMHEIIPIEIQGYPVRVTLIGDKPTDPCTQLYYKKPELIPEKYFTRVGKIKTIK
ncbi:MAG: hypothetical protein A2Y79_07925 [Deltaproteobacteria bacterium RBG_13_43_22]|nr:MAG: hypothetical protein A2Y79_07925 [Deltaproteobacteria bacterium RBG_13_43_22]